MSSTLAATLPARAALGEGPSAALLFDVVEPAAYAALVFVLPLAARALLGYTRTGPRISRKVLARYGGYAAWSFVRLVGWSFLVCFHLALWGSLPAVAWMSAAGAAPSVPAASSMAMIALVTAVGAQFSRLLLLSPATLAASATFDLRRFLPLWRRMQPQVARRLHLWLLAGGAIAVALPALALAARGRIAEATVLAAILSAQLGVLLACRAEREPKPPATRRRRTGRRPNFLLIGTDSLRADRIHASRQGQPLMPATARLAGQGAEFTNCFVPCARTAPSLISLLTSLEPPRHGARDNFHHPGALNLPQDTLPGLLARSGYRTAALGDWAAGDFSKFGLGFDRVTAPADQWNLRYLIRQGPADLRLFLSLFAHNAFGRRLLPEIHHLAGVPLTGETGRALRRQIALHAEDDAPFFLLAFMATTHAPFGSEYPYYLRFSRPEYAGPSKFVMSETSNVEQIVADQARAAESFDLEQVQALYDGCARRFDDEVCRTLRFLSDCGVGDDTVVVVFSDHGFELFETGSWGQGNSVVTDADLRVPLIVRDPRCPKAGAIDEVARIIDLAPTLLELAGVVAPSAFEGRSLAARVRGDPLPHPPLAAYAETGIWLNGAPPTPAQHLRYPDIIDLLDVAADGSGTLVLRPEFETLVVEAKDRMLRTAEWKLVYRPLLSGGELLLYDLGTDGQCRNDVGREHPGVVLELAARLRSLIDEGARLRFDSAVEVFRHGVADGHRAAQPLSAA